MALALAAATNDRRCNKRSHRMYFETISEVTSILPPLSRTRSDGTELETDCWVAPLYLERYVCDATALKVWKFYRGVLQYDSGLTADVTIIELK